MLTAKNILRVKNYVLAGVAVLYFLYCEIFSRDLFNRSYPAAQVLPSRDIEVYLRENLIYILFFLLFISVASTSFLLGYLFYHKFDRNRVASNTAVRAGLFFVFFAMFMICSTDALDIFSKHINTFDFFRDVGIMFTPLAFISYASNLNKKKWLRVVDNLFSAVVLLVFVCAVFGVSGEIIAYMIRGITLFTILLMLICSFLHTRDIFRRKSFVKVFHFVLGIIELLFLTAAAVLLALGYDRWYLLSLSIAVAVMAYLVFSELVNMAARQYINTAEVENYRKMAYIDKLCDVGNRNAFLLKQEETYDSDSLFYVVFDVNDMKRVNDQFGHSEGDKIIKRAARVIRDSFKEVGKCYRIGGDEFSVIGQYKDAADIEEAITNMKALISKYNSGSPVKLDLAYGYAVRENLEINTYELFNKADKAMYRYKHRSKRGLA